MTIGGLPCEVVPLHSTVNQIACKTPYYGKQQSYVQVSVLVDGVHEATCNYHNNCVFHFYNSYTPYIYYTSPNEAVEGTVVRVNGAIRGCCGSMDVLDMPKDEIAQIVVKVVDESVKTCVLFL